MSRNSSIKSFFQKLREKKQVETKDIDSIAILFLDFIKLSKEQFKTANEITDSMQRISMLIISLENLAKPIAISEVMPRPLQKWNISDEDFKAIIVKTGSDHEFKQMVMSQYGKTIRNLGYKHYIPENDVKMLQVIKERAQHGDSSFPYTEVQAKRLSKKLMLFLDERIRSIYMYENEETAKLFVRKLALFRNFNFPNEIQEFLKHISNEIKNYEQLCISASEI